MSELQGWDAEVSAFVCPFTGRWPTKDESAPAAGAARVGQGANRPDAQDGQFFTPQLRWARWDSEGRTLEVGVGPAVAPRSKCAIFYVYLPLSPQSQAPPLLFSGEGVPRGVSKALEVVSERASGKRTPLSVLVDQAVAAIDAGMRLGEHHSSLWSQQALLDSEISFDDVASACKQNRKALDVLVCFAAAACRSIKKVSLLDPFPPAFYDALGGTDFDACTQCLLALPPLGSLFDDSSDGRHHHLSTQQGLLLRWLCDLKGVEIKGVRAATAVTEHAGKGDFVIELSHGGEPTFDQAAEQYGTVQAFHGSALENFHCILRCGLKSFSGTKRMNTGDVYGEGVYLSSDYRLARSFATRGRVWPGSSLGTFITVVASCRIALHPSIKRQKETAKVQGTSGGMPLNAIPHTYYVVPDPRYVRVESIIVIPDGAGDANAKQKAKSGNGAAGARQQSGEMRGAGSTLPGPVKLVLFLVVVYLMLVAYRTGVAPRLQGAGGKF